MVEASAALVAWLGMSLIVLADGRRGLALGAALATAGIALIVFQGATPIDAGVLALGGLLMAARQLANGPGGWQLMPPGSTPRLVLCIAAGLLALWISGSVTSTPVGPLLFAVLVVLGLMAARVLTGRDIVVDRTAIACFALALASSPALASSTPAG